MLVLKYAIHGNVSTELRATVWLARICFLDARGHDSDTGGFSDHRSVKIHPLSPTGGKRLLRLPAYIYG